MQIKDPDLHDPVLTRELKSVLSGVRAPDDWVRHAHQIPLLAGAPTPSRALIILPHLFGLCLLVGLGVAWSLSPDVTLVAWETVRAGLLAAQDIFPDGASIELLGAVLMTPVLIAVLYQGSRGFPILHRRH